MTGPVAFVDIETTGLDPVRHEVWNVGLILPDGTEREWMLDPERLDDADPFALKLTRFFDRHPAYGGNLPFDPERTSPAYPFTYVSRHDFAREFRALTWGLHLAGAVVSFDEERLRRLLHTQGQPCGWHYHLIDVEALAVGRLAADAGGRELGPAAARQSRGLVRLPWKSEDLSRAVGVDPDQFERHTALGDARWAQAIYGAVMESDTPRVLTDVTIRSFGPTAVGPGEIPSVKTAEERAREIKGFDWMTVTVHRSDLRQLILDAQGNIADNGGCTAEFSEVVRRVRLAYIADGGNPEEISQ